MKTLRFSVVAIAFLAIRSVSADPAPAPSAAAPAVPAAAPAGNSVQVEKMAVGTAVDNHEISGAAAQFPASVGKLYCWNKVTVAAPPASFKNVWYADGHKEAEVALDVKYPSARTWSSKNVWPGSWKVEAVDDSGTVLSSVEFTVQ